jgi:AraC family transcriptional regulator, regulatory protein of adaptative response / DNA-3-methyladenine glycosylase II
MMQLDFDTCYRALQTRDMRFDGRFFTAVSTTRIFCRPICPAPLPRRENCQFYTSAAAAHADGFRPCLRCRPELSPDLLTYITTATTVNRALRLIGEGALDQGNVAQLAHRLGVGDRHLRRLFDHHLGVAPVKVAQMRRILFAKQLIDQTQLSMTDVAMASGFNSLRRFNATILETYGKSPRELRRMPMAVQTPETIPEIQLKLAFHPPYPWSALVHFLQPRIMGGIEVITPDYYRRSIALDGAQGWVEVQPVAHEPYLLAKIWFPKVVALSQIVERLRHLFDLRANVTEISAHLQTDPKLQPLVRALPGLRVPGAWDGFELAVRAILGQQVSVKAATTLASRLVQTYGAPLRLQGLVQPYPEITAVFPEPAVLATADLTQIGLTTARAAAIQQLAARLTAEPDFFHRFVDLSDAMTQLRQFPGIGEWTAHYIAMRALREPNAFPAGDSGLLRAMTRLGQPVSRQTLEQYSQVWQPWRAYAAMTLWMQDFVIETENHPCKTSGLTESTRPLVRF